MPKKGRKKGGFLADYRTSTGIAALTVLGLVGLFALSAIYALSDADITVETAGETSHQVTAVSSATSQAPANVRTVATAAEEKAASISRINREVNPSPKIDAGAVDSARESNDAVRGLAAACRTKVRDEVKLRSRLWITGSA